VGPNPRAEEPPEKLILFAFASAAPASPRTRSFPSSHGGFTPVEAIGTIAPGKQADLVVVDGNPAERIADIRKVKLVFQDGVAYDPA
jgi:hypothetical protein